MKRLTINRLASIIRSTTFAIKRVLCIKGRPAVNTGTSDKTVERNISLWSESYFFMSHNCCWKSSLKQRFVTLVVFFALGMLQFSALIQGVANSETPPLQTLRVVTDNNYPPYVFQGKDNLVQGILVDQWRLWQHKTGIQVEISAMDWGIAQKRMQAGEFDVIDTIFKTEDRLAWLEFGKPYTKIEVPAFFKNQISGITDIDSLKGFVVAVKEGDAAIEPLRRHGVENLVFFKGYEEIVLAAKEHKVNVFVIDKPPALYFLYKHGIEQQFNESSPFSVGEFHRAVKKGDSLLLQQIETGFARISPDELQQIDKKWYGAPLVSSQSTGYLLIGSGFLWIFLLFLFFWNRSLRTAVKKHTYELQLSGAELRKTKDLLTQTSRMARVGGWEKYPLTGADNWSEITREIMEVDPDFIPTMENGLDFYPEGISRDTIVEVVSRAIRIGAPFDVEVQIITAKGNKRWVRGIGCAEFKDGICVRLYGTLQDIDGRKTAEMALVESEERLRFLVQNSSDSLVIINADGTQRYVSPAAERITGFPVADLQGRAIDTIIHPDDMKAVRAAWKETLEHPEKTVTVQYRHVHKTRQWVYSEAIAQNFLSEPAINGVIASVRDITTHKRAEEDNERLHVQLTQAQKMETVGRLAGGVAHDFNNMLSVILGHAELALSSIDTNQPLFANLQEIRRAAKRSADLTRQLLAFARKQTVAPKVIDLNHTVEGMLKMLRRLIGEDIDLNWLPGDDLGPIKIDPSQVDQMLANLCVNARDAIVDTGKVTIKTESVAFDEDYCAAHLDYQPGEYILLAVSDNGSGMDSETIVHLFEPFFTTKEVGKGTGLGLATVYGIVKQNGGFINVTSTPGLGTNFSVYLPQHAGENERVVKSDAVSLATPVHATILLVEDEQMILDITKTMLNLQGYNVLAALTPGEAIRLAKEHGEQISLLMTDVVMPEMNGRDLAKNLLVLCPNLKRLFMSGYTADVIAHHGVLDEGVFFIQKPFTLQALASKIREVLG